MQDTYTNTTTEKKPSLITRLALRWWRPRTASAGAIAKFAFMVSSVCKEATRTGCHALTVVQEQQLLVIFNSTCGTWTCTVIIAVAAWWMTRLALFIWISKLSFRTAFHAFSIFMSTIVRSTRGTGSCISSTCQTGFVAFFTHQDRILHIDEFVIRTSIDTASIVENEWRTTRQTLNWTGAIAWKAQGTTRLAEFSSHILEFWLRTLRNTLLKHSTNKSVLVWFIDFTSELCLGNNFNEEKLCALMSAILFEHLAKFSSGMLFLIEHSLTLQKPFWHILSRQQLLLETIHLITMPGMPLPTVQLEGVI